MNKSTKDTARVGLFIFIGVLIFFLGVLTIGSMRKSFVKKIQAKVIFPNVEGLNKGNNVWYSGVKVGTVESISFLPDSQVEVVFTIEEKSREFIRQNAMAKLGSDGLIGNKLIEITGGTSEAPEVVDGFMFKAQSTDSQQDILNTLQENNKNILSITTDLKDVISDVKGGKGSVGKLLNSDDLYTAINATAVNLQAATAQTKALTNSLNAFTNDLTQFGNQLNKPGSLPYDLANNTTIVPELQETIKNLNMTAATIQQASTSTKEMIAELRASTQSILNDDDSPAGVLLHDPQAAADLKATLDNLEKSTQKLDENMEALQHTWPLKKYFKKQAKQ